MHFTLSFFYLVFFYLVKDGRPDRSSAGRRVSSRAAAGAAVLVAIVMQDFFFLIEANNSIGWISLNVAVEQALLILLATKNTKITKKGCFS